MQWSYYINLLTSVIIVGFGSGESGSVWFVGSTNQPFLNTTNSGDGASVACSSDGNFDVFLYGLNADGM